MSAGRRWIVAIVALLAGNVLAGVVLIAAAHHGESRILPNYYEEGVHYDNAIDQAARNQTLAWAVGISIEHGIATVTASDARGLPLVNATVHIAGVERSATARTIAGELHATTPGRYSGQVGGMGWLDVAVTIDLGSERYAHRVALEAR
ncbi:hypothetical protein BH11MYX1_BH11MYX1_00420 [soil metagenome]